MPTAAWPGNCHAVSCALLSCGLIEGTARYGHYYGPVSPGGPFSATAPFHRHGWIELPGGEEVVDPTRWVFQRAEPYLYLGPYDSSYDPGMQRLKSAMLRPPPGVSPGEAVVALDLTIPASDHLEAMVGRGRDLSLGQVFWVANLPLYMLGKHAAEVYAAIGKAGHKALVPCDNWDMAFGPGGPPAHAMRPPRPDGRPPG